MTDESHRADCDELVGCLETHRQQVIDLSHALHADPELGGQEFRAATTISEMLDCAGFTAESVPAHLPTAFRYRYGTSPLTVAVCIEYDALPGIGHACGHNVNAAAAVGAALVLRDMADTLDVAVLAVGTPAEESFGGKADLLEAGCFDDASLAMMVHASDHDAVGGRSLALCVWEVEFGGVPAHAAAAPDAGVNALDALVIAQTAIALARQQLPAESVVSINVTDGGSAVNVIPDRASAVIEMRAPDAERLATIQRKVRACLEGAGVAAGCTVEVSPAGNDFDDLVQDAALSEFYRSALTARGRTVAVSDRRIASTDMGNVSKRVPSIHPLIGYDTDGAHPHTAAFADYGATPSADEAVLDGAFGMAATAMAVALSPAERDRLAQS